MLFLNVLSSTICLSDSSLTYGKKIDAVGMDANQLQILASSYPVLIEAIVIAATARANDNRINQATPAASQSAKLSLAAFGYAAQATSNVTTYCIAVDALVPAWKVDANNIELAAQGDSKVCAGAQRIGDVVGEVLWNLLLAM